MCANIRYLISSRFTDIGHGAALGNSLSVITTCVEKIQLSDQALCELLAMVSELKVGRHQYTMWTSCIGAFMGKMGAYKFFKVLPLQLIEHDLHSLTYAQDSRSWLLPLIRHNLKIDAHLDFFVEYFMPMIIQLDRLRDLE